MRRQFLLAASVLALALAVAGCQQGDQAAEATSESMGEMSAPSQGGVVAPDGSSTTTTAVPDAQAPRLAYSYRYTLETPTRAVSGLASEHEHACTAAGPATCQVIGSSVERLGEDHQTASLELRATPAWLATFREGLAGQLDEADGRIANQTTESEDLTRALIDTEAHLNAKRALRDRLQVMLATRTGDLQSALSVETELARVQGEIDAAQSQLAVMRARVDMARLTVTYQSAGVLTPDSAVTPLKDALENAFGIVMMGFAAIIWIAAFALPFAIVIGPIVWFWLRRRRRSKAAKAAPPSPQS